MPASRPGVTHLPQRVPSTCHSRAHRRAEAGALFLESVIRLQAIQHSS